MGSGVVSISTFKKGGWATGTLRLLGRGFLPLTALLAGSLVPLFANEVEDGLVVDMDDGAVAGGGG